MDSLVLELQRRAMEKDADVAELVRMALVVARKLSLKDFERWADLEQKGYTNSAPPDYRVVHASVKAHNPYQGWIPVIMENAEAAEAAALAPCTNPISELQDMVTHRNECKCIHLPFSPEVERKMMRGFRVPLVPTRIIGITQIVGILDAVRNIILNWSLELEQNGILGKGLTFSATEKQKATTAPSIHITNFQGILGNVQTKEFQIGDYNSIRKQLKQLGIAQKAQNELENILDEYKQASGKKKRSLAERGLDWVEKHKKTLGKLATLINGWFVV